MTDLELEKYLKRIDEKLTALLYRDKGHFFIIIILVILLIKACE